MSVSLKLTNQQLKNMGYTKETHNDIPTTLGAIILDKVADTVCNRKILFRSSKQYRPPDIGFLISRSPAEICFGS